MKRSIFPRAPRQVQQTLATAQVFAEVRSEMDLRDAINRFAAFQISQVGPPVDVPTGNPTAHTGAGGTINVVGGFAVKSPIDIPVGCERLAIRSVSRTPIIASGVVECLFKVKCRGLGSTVEGFLVGDVGDPDNYFESFISCALEDAAIDLNYSLAFILGNIVYANRFLCGDDVALSADATDVGFADYVADNFFQKVNSLASGSISPLDARVLFYSRNSIRNPGGNACTIYSGVGGYGGPATIVANRWTENGPAFRTDGGGGGNILSGNLDIDNGGVVTKTLHANDVDLDARTPAAHAASHQNGGSDEISVAGLSGLLADGQTPLAHKASHQSGGSDAIKLDDLAAPDDNTDLNASSSAHGLLRKLSGSASDVLKGDGSWGSVSAGWTTITKTTTESRQSDTALTNDSTLQFSMTANTTYRIRLVVWFETPAAADFKYQIAGPGGPTRVNCRRIDAVAKGTPAFRALDSAYPGSTSLLAAVDGTGFVDAELDVENGATNADFRFLWAQVTSTASNTSVLKGSYLEYAVVA